MTDEELLWPAAEAFAVPDDGQIGDGGARCRGVAICDERGRPARTFSQGQAVRVFCEFAVSEEIGVPGAWVALADRSGRVIHRKSAFQQGIPLPASVPAGARLRYEGLVQLDLSPGAYDLTVGLCSTDPTSYAQYRRPPRAAAEWPGDSGVEEGPYQGRHAGLMTQEQFDLLVREHCRAPRAGSFIVGFGEAGRLTHDGAADLPGSARLEVVEPDSGAPPVARPPEPTAAGPTVLHVTHWKAGSQWLYRILQAAFPELTVRPQPGVGHFRWWPAQPGRIYPTLYLTKQQVDLVPLPVDTRRFVVIRDLRDTLVSGYFSWKASHRAETPRAIRRRELLQSVSLEQGLLYVMDEWLSDCARIQLSWLEAGERLLRYEELLEHDLEILERVLLDDCQLPVGRAPLREAILANRFERITGGRRRGEEDVAAHERKGVAGDWRNYFSERITRAFKARYGGLLVATGYERDLNW